MQIVESEQAWQAILEISRNKPSADRQAGRPLKFSADNKWTATCPVAPQAALILDTLLPAVNNTGRYVIAQLGQSLDGRIATVSGHSHYVTGACSRAHLHRLRAVVDAVIVGVDTVIADDPQLTVRHVSGTSPARVVLDPNGRVPPDRRIFTDGGPPTWHAVRAGIACVAGALPVYLDDAMAADVPHQLLTLLAAKGLRRILVEGGGITVSRFLEAGCIDRLHLVVAPFVIGSGQPALQLPAIETLDQACRPACRSHAMGEDRLYDLDFSKCGFGSANIST